MSENRSTPLFPKGCTCLFYGRGLTMTRVNVTYCPIHAPGMTDLMVSPESIDRFLTDNPPEAT